MTSIELPPLQPCWRKSSEPGWPAISYFADSVEARERIFQARIAELTTERDDALRKSAGARKYKEIVTKQKKKYIYVTSLAELAACGNDKAFACLLPCATLARDPDKNIKDVMNAALAASDGLFGKMADPYTDLEQAK